MVHQIEFAFAERQASEDRLRRFVADASHELRTPLTSIRGYTDLMQSGALDDPAAREDALRRVQAESSRMAELVDDLLVLARLDQGRPLERGPVDLVAVASDAVKDARAVAPEQPVELVAPPSPVVVQGDEGRLRQVVANLLTNARVHTPAGTPVTVRVGVEGPATAHLVVADEGQGMAPEVASRVFERSIAPTPRAAATGEGPASASRSWPPSPRPTEAAPGRVGARHRHPVHRRAAGLLIRAVTGRGPLGLAPGHRTWGETPCRT